jgi:hypothetical protein
MTKISVRKGPRRATSLCKDGGDGLVARMEKAAKIVAREGRK